MARQALMACHLRIVGILGDMAKSPKLGPTGETVRVNVRRLRDARGISAAELSKKLDALGRPIPLVGIQRIEAGERRPDTDDLVALAAALGVSPITLLIEDGDDPDAEVTVTGLTAPTTARRLWEWLVAVAPLSGDDDLFTFGSRAWPKWFRREQIDRERQAIHHARQRTQALLSGQDGAVEKRPADDDGDDQ